MSSPPELEGALLQRAKSLTAAGSTPVQRKMAQDAVVVLNTPIKPRVYIQIAGENQRETAKRLQSLLVNQGFLAPGIENVGGFAQMPSVTEVRYFRPEEMNEATSLVQLLKGSGVPVNMKPQKNTDPDSRPRHFEIWFSR